MGEKEIELNRKILEYEYYRQLLNSYQANLEAARILLTDVENAISSFETIMNHAGDAIEMYASIGSGSYVKFQYNKNEKVLINIGSKIYVEYTIQQALEFLNNKKKKITESITNTNKIIEELALIIAKLENEINQLSSSK